MAFSRNTVSTQGTDSALRFPSNALHPVLICKTPSAMHALRRFSICSVAAKPWMRRPARDAQACEIVRPMTGILPKLDDSLNRFDSGGAFDLQPGNLFVEREKILPSCSARSPRAHKGIEATLPADGIVMPDAASPLQLTHLESAARAPSRARAGLPAVVRRHAT